MTLNMLLSSKTKAPDSSIDTVERTRLDDAFRNNTLKKVTILRAPAGYGKTTTLSNWLKQTQGAIAWISLDHADNDPIRCWTYVLHAVAKAYQTNTEQVLAPLLHSQEPATLEFFINAFLEEISSIGKPIHIVLDDYHLITNPIIHQRMTQFIEQLPEQVQVYLTTRTALPLPIAKWRVKQWVHEINSEQLRFTLQEAKQFFAMKNLPASNHDVLQLIMEKTEGWVAGLILASLVNDKDSLQQWQEQAQPFISEFLWQEIIANLPSTTQAFLIRTSLLNELDPVICDQLTKHTNSRELLEELEAKGLFITRLQAPRPVFRYHHLFAEALQIELNRQLSVQQVKTTVQETALLIYDKGDYISAIELSLKHELYDQAILWITTHLVQLFLSGQTATFMRWLHQLRSNHYTVPYEMLVMGFLTSISTMEVETATSLMQELELRQHTERWMEQDEHAGMAYIYESAKAYAIVASGGDLLLVEEIMRKLLDKGPAPSRWDNVPIPYNIFEYKLVRTSLGSRGKLQTLEEGAAIGELFRETALQTANVTAFSYGVAAESLYERNLLEATQTELEIAIRLGHQFNDPGLFIPMYLLKAKIYMQQNQLNSAQSMLTQVLETVSEKHWQTSLRIMQAYGYVVAGDIQNAEMILQATKTKQPFWQLVYARLLLLKEQPNDALTVLIQVKTKAQQDDQIATIVEATVLEAICHNRLGNTKIALDILHEGLVVAAKFYYVRTFLDEKEILPLLNRYFKEVQLDMKWDPVPEHYFNYLKTSSKTSTITNELLTSREQEIFDLLANGNTNREIANHLHLSEGTVRVYVSTIYSKLGVNSRAKAINIKNQQG